MFNGNHSKFSNLVKVLRGSLRKEKAIHASHEAACSNADAQTQRAKSENALTRFLNEESYFQQKKNNNNNNNNTIQKEEQKEAKKGKGKRTKMSCQPSSERASLNINEFKTCLVGCTSGANGRVSKALHGNMFTSLV